MRSVATTILRFTGNASSSGASPPFFSGIQSTRVQDFLLPGKEIPDKREIAIPGTPTVVQAKVLGHNTEP